VISCAFVAQNHFLLRSNHLRLSVYICGKILIHTINHKILTLAKAAPGLFTDSYQSKA